MVLITLNLFLIYTNIRINNDKIIKGNTIVLVNNDRLKKEQQEKRI